MASWALRILAPRSASAYCEGTSPDLVRFVCCGLRCSSSSGKEERDFKILLLTRLLLNSTGSILRWQISIDPTENFLKGTTSNCGTKFSSTFVDLSCGAFNTNFTAGGDHVCVYRADIDDGFSTSEQYISDMIKGACSIKCEGPNTLVGDTSKWAYKHPQDPSGRLDVKLVFEAASDDSSEEKTELLLENSFFYSSMACKVSPAPINVSPNVICSEGDVALSDVHFEYWSQD